MGSPAPASPLRQILDGQLSQLSREVERLFDEARGRARRDLSDQLNQAVRRFRQAVSPDQVAATLLDAAAAFAAGAAIFRIAGPAAQGERIRGVSNEAGKAFGSLEIPLSSAPALAGAVESRDPVIAVTSGAEVGPELMSLAAHPADGRAFIFPLVVRDRVPRLLYCWGPVQVAALEMLAQVAGAMWDSLAVAQAARLVVIEPAAVAGVAGVARAESERAASATAPAPAATPVESAPAAHAPVPAPAEARLAGPAPALAPESAPADPKSAEPAPALAPAAAPVEPGTAEPNPAALAPVPAPAATPAESTPARADLKPAQPAPAPTSESASGEPKPAAPPPPPAEPVSAWDGLPAEEQAIHLRALRFARVRVAEMRLDGGAAVEAGRTERDLYRALRPRIDDARETFRRLYLALCPNMADYFHVEMVRTLAHDDPELLGKDYPGPLV